MDTIRVRIVETQVLRLLQFVSSHSRIFTVLALLTLLALLVTASLAGWIGESPSQSLLSGHSVLASIHRSPSCGGIIAGC